MIKRTLYFDENGYIYKTLKEAKSNSVHKEKTWSLKPQQVKVYTDVELSTIEYCPDEYNYYIYSMEDKPLIACFDYKKYCKEI